MRTFKKILYAVMCAGLLIASLGVQPVYAASIMVNSNTDTIANDGACTLREAIINANSNDQSGSTDCTAGSGADAITFAGNYTITLAGSQLPVVTSPITITGNGAANTIIQAHAAPNVATYRVFEVANSGNLTLERLTVRHGRCTGTCVTNIDSGGGIYNNGILNLNDSALSNNSVSDDGAGIYNNSSLNLTNSTLSGNTSSNGSGGGIFNSNNNSVLEVANSTFSGNSALTGGGIFNAASATVTIINSTFSENRATFGDFGGSGIFNIGTLNYSNTIIANGLEKPDCYSFGTINTNISNLVEEGNCLPDLTTDPNLGPLADNGGPTQTHALLSGSPAIDAGDTSICANAPINNLDQRGVVRPMDGDAIPGAVCDIGSYEYSSDSTFPTVIFTSLIASYASGSGPSNFTVTYSENVFDPIGNTNANDATNPANYLIVEDGADNVFSTASCFGGLAGDDTQVTIMNITYNAWSFTATVTLNGAVPDGNYRLFVCGTTSIIDLSLNELNNGLSDYTFDFVVAPATVTTVPTVTASSLPTTGFAPYKVTQLPAQPAELSYTAMGDIWLEIPSQQIESNIVGIPQAQDNTWDVTWLGNDTGWLNGTAFPTWNGNSVLTAHVTNADGLPGPFANIKNLKSGDQIIVHLFDQSYIYEVQTSRMMRPYSTSFAFQSMQDHSYLTLITCQGYIPFSDSYFFRRIVRAVLVEVK